MEEMRSGYRRYAWGGVEIGGFFIGSLETPKVLVESYVLISCSHERGPSFRLSEPEREGLRASMDDLKRDGLRAVGWFHSISNRQELLDRDDEAFLSEHFPESWQFGLVFRRSKKAEPVPSLFVRSGSQLVTAAYAMVPVRAAASVSGRDPEVEFASRYVLAEELATSGLRLADVEDQSELPISRPDPSVIGEPQSQSGGEPDARPPQTLESLPATAAGAPLADESLSREVMVDTPPDTCVVLPCDPFTLTPNPALFYPSKQHREAIEGLLNGIRTRKGFLLLSAESGMGKTMVLECLMDRLKQEKIEYGFIFNSRLAVGDLFEMLHADFGLETASLTKTSVLIALNNLLLKFAGEGKTVALLVDDAHQLSQDVLEEIELMSNLETRQGKLLQVVFAARPEFELRLGEDALRGLRSRVMRRFRLGPLSEEETAGYIGVRLNHKPGHTRVPESLFGEIHRHTGGVPRMITALCGAAIERCEETQAASVDQELLEQVASEFGV